MVLLASGMIADAQAPLDALVAAGGIVGLIIGVFLLVLAIAWLLLPFLLLSALKELRNEVAATRRTLEGIQAASSQYAGEQAERQARLLAATNEHLQNLFDAATRTNAILDWGAQTAAQHLPPPK